MRTLSRPMFNMGGPIKEGVMHGIREPYKGGQLVRPGPGRPGYAGEAEINWWKKLSNQMPKGTGTAVGTAGATTAGIIATNKARAANMASKFKGLFEVPLEKRLTKAVRGTGRFLRKTPRWPYNISQWMSTQFPKATLSRYLPTGAISVPSSVVAPYVYGAHKLQQSLPKQLTGEGGIYDTSGGWGAMAAGADVPPEVDEIIRGKEIDITGKPLKTLDENLEMPARDTGSDYGQFDRAQKRIAEGKATELAKADKDDRVNKLLEMMGHKQSKKDAVYDALIDASQIVTQAPGGKTLDITKDIISPAIAATSKRFDKPKEIEEAVRLMMVKGEIEKDIASGKGGPLKQNAKDLVAAGVFKNETEAMKHLASKKTMGNVVAEVSKQFGISGANADVLDTSLRIKEDVIPQGKWKGDNKVYKEFKNNNKDKEDIELEFVKDIDDRKAGDYYIVDKRIVLVDENLNPDYYY